MVLVTTLCCVAAEALFKGLDASELQHLKTLVLESNNTERLPPAFTMLRSLGGLRVSPLLLEIQLILPLWWCCPLPWCLQTMAVCLRILVQMVLYSEHD